MHNYFFVLFIVVLSSCCEGVTESDRIFLTEEDTSSAPYQANQKIPFKHNLGLEFYFTVSERSTQLEQTETEHCGDTYITYESERIRLTSLTPQIDIVLEIAPKEINPFIQTSINGYWFELEFMREPDVETIVLNGTTFEEVYYKEAYILDTSIIMPKSILYTREDGIIEITMTNDEKFTIN